jgi:thymidylate kinase
MKIITISGLDGSGKTTQANLLEKHWQKKDWRVFHFHAAQFSVANRLLVKKSKRGSGQSPAVTRASWFKICLRKVALLIDLVHFRARLPFWRRRFDFLLADRYFFDQLLNIAFLEDKNSLEEFSPSEETLARLIPRPSYCFFIELEPQEILKRDREVEQGLGYLKKKNTLYQSLAQRPFFIKIDGNQSKQTIFEKILGEIK